MITPPCLDCCQRHVGCHSICELYQEYVEQKAMRNPEEREYLGYVSDAIKRMKRERA